jgi:hypothetical protein
MLYGLRGVFILACRSEEGAQASAWTVSAACPVGSAGAAFVLCSSEVDVVEQRVAYSPSPQQRLYTRILHLGMGSNSTSRTAF